MSFNITLSGNRIVRRHVDHIRDRKDTQEQELETDDDWLSQAVPSPTPIPL